MTLPQLLDSLSDILDTARLSGQVLQADMPGASPAHREALAGLAGLLDTAHGLMARVEMHPAWFTPGAAAMLAGQVLDTASAQG